MKREERKWRDDIYCTPRMCVLFINLYCLLVHFFDIFYNFAYVFWYIGNYSFHVFLIADFPVFSLA